MSENSARIPLIPNPIVPETSVISFSSTESNIKSVLFNITLNLFPLSDIAKWFQLSWINESKKMLANSVTVDCLTWDNIALDIFLSVFTEIVRQWYTFADWTKNSKC